MEVISTAITAGVVATVGLILGRLGRGRFEAQDRRIDRLQERLEHGMDALQASVEAMRSDLTQVALAMGVRPGATNG